MEAARACHLRLSGIAPRSLLLLGTEGIGVRRAVVVAGHDGLLGAAKAAPVVGCAGVDLDAGGSEAAVDDAVDRVLWSALGAL